MRLDKGSGGFLHPENTNPTLNPKTNMMAWFFMKDFCKRHIFNENYLFGLFRIIKAAMTPGTQPQIVNSNTIRIDPHPLSRTAKGGNRMASSTRQKLMVQN